VRVTAPRETRYARNGGVHLAYQILSDGSTDVLQVGSGVFASVQSLDEEPHALRFTERLVTMCRLTRFDMRGLGLSDTLSEPPRLEDQTDDIIAVMDKAEIEKAVLYAAGFGTASALNAAIHYPDRLTGLILANALARFAPAPDYPIGRALEELEATRQSMTQPNESGDATVDSATIIMPSLADDPQFREWWARAGRQGASPKAAFMQYEPMFTLDLRAQLEEIRVPTLLFQSPENWLFQPEHGEYLAKHIPDARYVELESADRMLFGANAEHALDEIEEFLTGARTGISSDRVLANLLFTDIVDSTKTAASLGDRTWHDRLDAHDAAARVQLRRFGGREVNTTGDGFLAWFDTTANALNCARALVESAHASDLKIRAGVHTGECERRGNDLAGLAVHIAARVAALAGPDEILVSRTVRDIVVGSSLRFEPRGEHELKGVPERWSIYALQP
jgi:class 3 adenylate cyclase